MAGRAFWRVLASGTIACSPAVRRTGPDFARDVAPIFEQHCIRCHQPSNKQGDLSLATFDDLASKDYIDREHPAESYLLEIVTAADGEGGRRCPRRARRLTANEVATLRAGSPQAARGPRTSWCANGPRPIAIGGRCVHCRPKWNRPR